MKRISNSKRKVPPPIMGDRGNIAVIQSIGQVWFYTHYTGHKVKDIAREALGSTAGCKRATDEPYLARIIFDQMVPKEEHGEEGGYGISATIQDNSYPIVVVDVPKQRVFLINEHQLVNGQVPPEFTPSPGEVWTFEEYIALKPEPQEESD